MKKWIFAAFLGMTAAGWECVPTVLSAEGLAVCVEPLEGEAFSAKLTGFEKNSMLLEPASEKAEPVPVSLLRLLAFKSVNEAESSISGNDSSETAASSPALKVLISESIFMARSVTFTEGKFHLIPLAGGNVEPLKLGQIQQILFQEDALGKDADLDADWNEIQSLETSSDLLVILRNGKLSYYYGTVLEMTENAVRFEQDGDSLNVKLKHVFALRFTETGGKVPTDSEEKNSVSPAASLPLLGVLTDAFGSRIFISGLTLPAESPAGTNPVSGPSVQITATSGLCASFPVSSLRVLDFTEGRAVFLSSLKPESVEWKPFFALDPDSELPIARLPSLQAFCSPQKDRGFSGEKIRLGGKDYASGLELSSQTRMVFRLPGSFQTFQTVLGIDDSVRPGGNADVTILADDRILFQGTITGKDAPKPLSLNVSGARRLTLLVDFGQEGSLSDHAAFADAQLTK